MTKYQLVFLITVLSMFELVTSTKQEETEIENSTKEPNLPATSRALEENADQEFSENLSKEENGFLEPELELENTSAENLKINQELSSSKNLTDEENGLKKPGLKHTLEENINQVPVLTRNLTKIGNSTLKPKSELQHDISKLGSINNSTLEKNAPPKKTDIVSRLFKHFDVSNWDQLHEKLPQLKSPPSEKFLQALESDTTEANTSSEKINSNINSSTSLINKTIHDIPQNKSESLPTSSKNVTENSLSPINETIHVIPQNKFKSLPFSSKNVTESLLSPINSRNESTLSDQTMLEVENANLQSKAKVDTNETEPIKKVDEISTEKEPDPDLFSTKINDKKITQPEISTTIKPLKARSVNKSKTTFEGQNQLNKSEVNPKENQTLNALLPGPTNNTSSDSGNSSGIELRSLHLSNKLENLKSILQQSGTDRLVYDPSVDKKYVKAQGKRPFYNPKFKPLPLPFIYGNINKNGNKKSNMERLSNRSIVSKVVPQTKLNATKIQTENFPQKKKNISDPDTRSEIVLSKTQSPDKRGTDDQLSKVNNDTNKAKDVGLNDTWNNAGSTKDSERKNKSKLLNTSDDNKFKEIRNSTVTAVPETEKLISPPTNSSESNTKSTKKQQIPKELNETRNGTQGQLDTFLRSITQVLMEKIANLELLINQTNNGKNLNKTQSATLPNNNTLNKSYFNEQTTDKIETFANEGKMTTSTVASTTSIPEREMDVAGPILSSFRSMRRRVKSNVSSTLSKNNSSRSVSQQLLGENPKPTSPMKSLGYKLPKPTVPMKSKQTNLTFHNSPTIIPSKFQLDAKLSKPNNLRVSNSLRKISKTNSSSNLTISLHSTKENAPIVSLSTPTKHPNPHPSNTLNLTNSKNLDVTSNKNLSSKDSKYLSLENKSSSSPSKLKTPPNIRTGKFGNDGKTLKTLLSILRAFKIPDNVNSGLRQSTIPRKQIFNNPRPNTLYPSTGSLDDSKMSQYSKHQKNPPQISNMFDHQDEDHSPLSDFTKPLIHYEYPYTEYRSEFFEEPPKFSIPSYFRPSSHRKPLREISDNDYFQHSNSKFHPYNDHFKNSVHQGLPSYNPYTGTPTTRNGAYYLPQDIFKKNGFRPLSKSFHKSNRHAYYSPYLPENGNVYKISQFKRPLTFQGVLPVTKKRASHFQSPPKYAPYFPKSTEKQHHHHPPHLIW